MNFIINNVKLMLILRTLTHLFMDLAVKLIPPLQIAK